MHASLLNEDLIQPGKLEMGISHRNGGRTRHFDWGPRFVSPAIGLVWGMVVSGVLLTRSPATRAGW